VGNPAAAGLRIRCGVVADHALVEGDRATGAAAAAVAAGDTAAARATVVIDGTVVEGQARGDAEDAATAAARLRHRVPAHLALVQCGGGAEPVGDPAAGVRGEVLRYDGAVQGQRAREVQDAAARTAGHPPRHVPAGDSYSIESQSAAGAAVDGDDPEARAVARDRCVLAVDRYR